MTMTRGQFVDELAKVGLVGMAREGHLDYILVPQGAPALHIVHKGDMATYTPTINDNGAYMVFDHPGDMTITLPASIVADEATPFTMFVVNTLGRIDLVPETGFVGFAPHVAKAVTCGLLRGSINWYASGTNNKEELA